MAQYNFKIKTRPIFAAQDTTTVGELFSANIKCTFRDDAELNKDFSVVATSDEYRKTTQTNYHTDMAVVDNGQNVVGRAYWRQFVQVVPQAGFYGSYFQFAITKTIPVTGVFKYFGIDPLVISRPELDAEFLFGGNANNNGWPT